MTKAAEVTEQELARRTAERRAEVAAQKTMPTSKPEEVAKTIEDSIDVRTQRCANCEEGYSQTRVPSGRWVPLVCPACNPPSAAAAEAPADEGYRGNILEDLDTAGINVRKYHDATLETFDPSDDPRALDAALAWIEAWASAPRKRFASRDWVYFFGGGSTRDGRKIELGKLGNGKTFLAIAMARALIERSLLDARRFLFRTAESILLESEATFRSNSDESEKNLLRFYERPDLLIIDDLGVRHDPSPHAIRIFDELTKRREANGTIWTSNLSIPVLSGSNESMRRIADRITGECGDGACYVVPFHGPSRRRERSLRRTA